MSPDQKHTYKLYYVNARGRGEPIRLILHFFNVDFEDVRMDAADMPTEKMKAPMCQLPWMEIDGKTSLCQTVAICRYLGKSLQPERWFGGATKTDSAKVDMFADAFTDVFNAAMHAKYAPPEIKEFMMKTWKDTSKIRLDILQNLLKKSKGDYFVAKTCHWCDLYILGVLGAIEEFDEDFLVDFPELKAYYVRMRNLPEIKEYIETNWPATKYE